MLRKTRIWLGTPRSVLAQTLRSARGQSGWVKASVALTALLIGFELMLIQVTGVRWRQLTSDPNALAGHPWYFGFMELASSLILAAAAGAALFSATLATGPARRFILWASVFTMVLSLDDIYMLHEAISERSIYAVYGTYMLVLLAFHRNYLMQTPVLLAIVAVGCLASAAIADTLTDWHFVDLKGAEEAVELFAFCLWSAYVVSCSRQALQQPS